MGEDTEVAASLYRQVIGESFDHLPPVLHRFHGASEGGIAEGTLRVTRGQGRLRNLAAGLMRLPKPGEQVPISLEVRRTKRGEQWVRRFGDLCLITDQWKRAELLVEAAGPMQFEFRLEADAKGLVFRFVRCRFLGIPLWYTLGPRVHAQVRGRAAAWWVEVRVEAPLLGEVTRYEGEVTPRC